MELTIFILRLAIYILAFPIYLLNFLGLWSRICKKCFPYFLARFTVMYNEQMASKKRELFGNLQEFAGPSGKLSLLEVGCGTGANFRFYPPGCRVTCIDPNPNFEKFLIKSIAENRHLQFERFVIAAGENMHQVADGSVDVVVCTLVLCSVKNQQQILREVCRVLRPVSERGGAFYFMEHVAAERSTWNSFWQQVLDPVWPLLFDGCSLTRESWKTLERAGFSKLKLQHIQAPLSWEMVRPHIYGYAVK
uniref:Thiol methyltransferase 1A n=1 Tax=Macaca fascicularis TaxID=9541 RepID=A0A2K5UWE0_MACFA